MSDKPRTAENMAFYSHKAGKAARQLWVQNLACLLSPRATLDMSLSLGLLCLPQNGNTPRALQGASKDAHPQM